MSQIGLTGSIDFAYSQDDKHHVKYLGDWIDGIFAATPVNNIENVDAATQRIVLDDPTLTCPCVDDDGQNFRKQITAVRRVKLANIPNHKMIKFSIDASGYPVMLSETPVVGRVESRVQGKPASQYSIGDMVATGMNGYTKDGSIVRPVSYTVHDYNSVSPVVTNTWGELSLTRGDAANFEELCLKYPEFIDPQDYSVFKRVLLENVTYQTVTRLDNYTASNREPNVYWVETEYGNFSLYATNVLFGTTPEGDYIPIYESSQSNQTYQTHQVSKVSEQSQEGLEQPKNATEILKSFNITSSNEQKQ